jgi:3-oxoacyl-[acyl-carrier protein] reductase
VDLGLEGKVALVTGAGRGIGLAVARELGREGCRVAALDLSRGALGELVGSWSYGELLPLAADVADSSQVEGAVGNVLDRWSRVDILVNNAGIYLVKPLSEMREEEWDRVVAVNLKGVFNCCRSVLPAMKKARWGRIINASSFAAKIPALGACAYAASKAGVLAFSRVLAGEVGPYNITVNCYIPGTIATEMTAGARAEWGDSLLGTLALRRWGEPEDVARAVLFLASEAAGYITGASLEISGGKLVVQNPWAAYEDL